MAGALISPDALTRLSLAQLSKKNIPIHEFILSTDEQELDRQLADICRLIELHPLTLEDCKKGNQRAKFEAFPDYFFVVLHHFGCEIHGITELHVVVRHDLFMILTHQPAPGGGKWSEFLQLTYAHNLSQLMHRVFDMCIDSAMTRAACIEDLISKAESLIVADKYSPKHIMKLKHETIRFQRAVNGVFPVLRELMANCDMSTDIQLMYRDIIDHQERLRHEIAFLHTDLVALFDLHYSAAGHSTSEQMKRINVLATFVVPLAFWTGFFGMNFQVLPFDQGWFFAVALSLMAGSVVAVFLYLRRSTRRKALL